MFLFCAQTHSHPGTRGCTMYELLLMLTMPGMYTQVWQAERSGQQCGDCIQGKHFWPPGGALALKTMKKHCVLCQNSSEICRVVWRQFAMVAVGLDLKPSCLADSLVVDVELLTAHAR